MESQGGGGGARGALEKNPTKRSTPHPVGSLQLYRANGNTRLKKKYNHTN